MDPTQKVADLFENVYQTLLAYVLTQHEIDPQGSQDLKFRRTYQKGGTAVQIDLSLMAFSKETR